MSFKELLVATGMLLSKFAEYFNIPYRTAQNWKADSRKCPEYVLELIEYKLKNERII